MRVHLGWTLQNINISAEARILEETLENPQKKLKIKTA